MSHLRHVPAAELAKSAMLARFLLLRKLGSLDFWAAPTSPKLFHFYHFCRYSPTTTTTANDGSPKTKKFSSASEFDFFLSYSSRVILAHKLN